VEGSLTLVEVPAPALQAGEVRIAVHATAVNRADLIQRAGHYRPPPGATDILGLECAGVVTELAPEVTDWQVGDRVCALLSGGGYASEVCVPAGQLLPIPDTLAFDEAAALPEVVCTVHDALFVQAAVQPGERVLIHAGGSGIGTMALQLMRELGALTAVTASAEKLPRCLALGATTAIDRKAGDWWAHPSMKTGFDVVLDPVGAGYLPHDLAVLNTRGRVVLLGLMGGRRAEIDLGRVLVKRLQILGTVLRARSTAEKADVVERVRAEVWPWIATGRVKPITDVVLPLARAEEAHRRLAANQTTGKVVLSLN